MTARDYFDEFKTELLAICGCMILTGAVTKDDESEMARVLKNVVDCMLVEVIHICKEKNLTGTNDIANVVLEQNEKWNEFCGILEPMFGGGLKLHRDGLNECCDARHFKRIVDAVRGEDI